MQAEVVITNRTAITGRLVLEKGRHALVGIKSHAPSLAPPEESNSGTDLIVAWDPAVRALVLKDIAAPALRKTLRAGESISFDEISLTFLLTWAMPRIGGIAFTSMALNPAHRYLFCRGTQESGESQACVIALDADDRTISKLHASLTFEEGGWFISDQSSTETLLNGEPFTRAKLIFGDRFKIGEYVFEFRGSRIERVDHADSGRIEARGLSVVVSDRLTRKPLEILKQVSLSVGSGRFIGILGGSGQGKSTLLNALCGIRSANSGTVTIGGVNTTVVNKIRPGTIGFVPQDDIVHPELVVLDAFHLAARLRLRLDKNQRHALVERTIGLLGLAEHAEKRVQHLSGGQRKRVSIGIELLSKPSVLFLDEPSSGLDPATEESLMELLQSLTLTNLTVVCTTHVLQKAYLFDRLVFIHGGRLIFEGNANQARDFFTKRPGETSESHSGSRSSLGVVKSPLERIYSEVLRGDRAAEEWEEMFLNWRGTVSSFPEIGQPAERPGVKQKIEKRVAARTRFFTLLLRQWKILMGDWLNLAFLFCQVVLIGIIIAVVSDEFGFRLFLGLIATMWFGCSNGAQEIVGELPVVKREQVCGLGRNVYLSSKFAFHGLVSGIQSLLLFCIIMPLGSMIHPVDFDGKTFADLYLMRLVQDGMPVAGEPGDEGDGANFSAVGDDETAPPSDRVPDSKRKKEPGTWEKLTYGPPVWLAATAARWFVMEDSFIDSGRRPINDLNGNPMSDTHGDPLEHPSVNPWKVFLIGVFCKVASFLGAALVGVSLGLAVSAWVRNPTQAVMWVPLLLIPQILFGGYVVTLPKMLPSIREISCFFPSNACQRIIDVSNLFGRATPFVTNLTKQPVFLTGAAKAEEIAWKENGVDVSEAFDRESYVNTSWLNLAVYPDRLGQHKKVWEVAGTDEYGSEIKRKRDTVEVRGDVRYTKGTPYLFLFPAVISSWILAGWIGGCYGFAFFGLYRKTQG